MLWKAYLLDMTDVKDAEESFAETIIHADTLMDTGMLKLPVEALTVRVSISEDDYVLRSDGFYDSIERMMKRLAWNAEGCECCLIRPPFNKNDRFSGRFAEASDDADARIQDTQAGCWQAYKHYAVRGFCYCRPLHAVGLSIIPLSLFMRK